LRSGPAGWVSPMHAEFFKWQGVQLVISLTMWSRDEDPEIQRENEVNFKLVTDASEIALKDRGIAFMSVPIQDHTGPNYMEYEKIFDMVKEFVFKRIHVFCGAGYGRSGLVIGAALVNMIFDKLPQAGSPERKKAAKLLQQSLAHGEKRKWGPYHDGFPWWDDILENTKIGEGDWQGKANLWMTAEFLANWYKKSRLEALLFIWLGEGWTEPYCSMFSALDGYQADKYNPTYKKNCLRGVNCINLHDSVSRRFHIEKHGFFHQYMVYKALLYIAENSVWKELHELVALVREMDRNDHIYGGAVMPEDMNNVSQHVEKLVEHGAAVDALMFNHGDIKEINAVVEGAVMPEAGIGDVNGLVPVRQCLPEMQKFEKTSHPLP